MGILYERFTYKVKEKQKHCLQATRNTITKRNIVAPHLLISFLTAAIAKNVLSSLRFLKLANRLLDDVDYELLFLFLSRAR